MTILIVGIGFIILGMAIGDQLREHRESKPRVGECTGCPYNVRGK